MRYIRTKDGRVFDIGKFMADAMDTEYYKDFEFADLENRNGETLIRWTAVGTKSNDYVEQRGVRCQFSASIISPFIKQSDDIEELCDEIVAFKRKADGYDWGILNAKDYICGSKHEMDEYHADGYSVYGAIWTERGLKYVAKMNDKGEWELMWR